MEKQKLYGIWMYCWEKMILTRMWSWSRGWNNDIPCFRHRWELWETAWQQDAPFADIKASAFWAGLFQRPPLILDMFISQFSFELMSSDLGQPLASRIARVVSRRGWQLLLKLGSVLASVFDGVCTVHCTPILHRAGRLNLCKNLWKCAFWTFITDQIWNWLSATLSA